MANIYKLDKYGKVVLEIINNPSIEQLTFPVSPLKPFSVDGAREKHIPQVIVNGNIVDINVGEIDHPMSNEHYIEYVVVETNKATHIKTLHPGDLPHAQFGLIEGDYNKRKLPILILPRLSQIKQLISKLFIQAICLMLNLA